jgi:hypothetical protein
MPEQHLSTYLSDHLAALAAALELLEHLERLHTGKATDGFVAELRADITADRKELEALMARLHISVSPPRKVAAWVTEKLTELKLRLDAPENLALRRLEALEAISIGIEGKRLLWLALDAAAEDVPQLRIDYDRLRRRAEDQRERVEVHRREAAKAVLADHGAQR